MTTLTDDDPSPEPSSIPGPSSITLYLINGVATVWDAQVAATLHRVHNISGLRAGTLPGVSQQNGFLGLPVTLMAEETAYLLDQGIAHLIPLNPSPQPPSPEVIKAHTEARVARIQAIEEAARQTEEKRLIESRKAFEKAGESAKAKREARARLKAKKQATAAGGSETNPSHNLFGDGDAPNPKNIVVQPTPKSDVIENQSNTKSIPKQSVLSIFHAVPSHPHFPPVPPYDQPITNLPHPLFQFPNTPREKALVSVFTTLMKRNYRMGLGPRFGGEYLVYPGDYLRYHAHFTSQVLVRDESIKPTELVAWGRLGTGTKKAGLICCWDDRLEKEEEVEFYSLEWANFG